MNTEIIAPRKSDDGIVFYVSADGSKTGISVSGLERLLGFSAQGNMFSGKYALFKDMAEGGRRESVPKFLKPVWGNVFTPAVKGSDGARIVSAKAAVCIIKYYALERNNEKAMHSLDQFIEKGFDAWVKEVTHFSTEPIGLNDQLKEVLSQLLDEKLEAVVGKATKWDNLDGITATVYPGMKALNDGLSHQDSQKLLITSDLYTASNWLLLKNIIVDNGTRLAFCRQAADTFLTMTGVRPPDKYEMRETATGVRSVKAGKGYKMIDFHILETAWESYKQNQDELKSKPKAKRGRPKKAA